MAADLLVPVRAATSQGNYDGIELLKAFKGLCGGKGGWEGQAGIFSKEVDLSTFRSDPNMANQAVLPGRSSSYRIIPKHVVQLQSFSAIAADLAAKKAFEDQRNLNKPAISETKAEEGKAEPMVDVKAVDSAAKQVPRSAQAANAPSNVMSGSGQAEDSNMPKFPFGGLEVLNSTCAIVTKKVFPSPLFLGFTICAYGFWFLFSRTFHFG